MSESAQIPRLDGELWIDHETEPVDVLAFIERRLAEPSVIDDVAVWSFHNQGFDAHALLEMDLEPGTYVIPYQVPGVWGFMVDVLPALVADAKLLTYRRDESRYEVYENYRTEPIAEAVREDFEQTALRAVRGIGGDE